MARISPPRRVLVAAYPPDGGVARHIVSIVSGLDPGLWRFDIACLPGSVMESELGQLANVRVHHLKGCHPGLSPRDGLDLPRLLRLVGGADIVHAHSSKAGFLVRLAAVLRGRRGRTIFTPHAWSFWAAKGKEKRLYIAIERLAAKWCRAIVTVSEAEREAGIEARIGSSEQYRVILNGIDPTEYAREPSPTPGKIVMVSRLSRQKRPDVAIRALAVLRQSAPEAQLDIVGGGPLRSETEGLIARLGLTDSVRLLGDRADVPDLLATAACYVMTSDYEGCPLSVLEAMAAGVPVVATDIRGLSELVVDGETGFLVEAGQPEAIAAALFELLSGDESARAMGLAGRRRVHELFSSRRMTVELEALYREVSGRGITA